VFATENHLSAFAAMAPPRPHWESFFRLERKTHLPSQSFVMHSSSLSIFRIFGPLARYPILVIISRHLWLWAQTEKDQRMCVWLFVGRTSVQRDASLSVHVVVVPAEDTRTKNCFEHYSFVSPVVFVTCYCSAGSSYRTVMSEEYNYDCSLQLCVVILCMVMATL